MMWLSWRQFRTPAIVGSAVLALATIYLVYLGMDIRDAYDAYRTRCEGIDDCGQAMSPRLRCFS